MKILKLFLYSPFKFIQIPLKVAFILEKSRLYFRDDSPVIPVFFQLESRGTPVIIILLFLLLLDIWCNRYRGPTRLPSSWCTSRRKCKISVFYISKKTTSQRRLSGSCVLKSEEVCTISITPSASIFLVRVPNIS